MTQARSVTVPAWCTLTDEEIGMALAILSQRKTEGTGFAVAGGGVLPEWSTVQVPVNCALRQEDIVTALNVANRAAQEKHANAILKFRDGVIVNMKIELGDPLGPPRYLSARAIEEGGGGR